MPGTLQDTVKRREGLIVRNDGSDQCKAKCPVCNSKCGNVGGHKNSHRCIKGHTFDRFICPECGENLDVATSHKQWEEGKNKCSNPKCGWEGRADKTEKMGKIRKPWNDGSGSLVGPHLKSRFR